jgi:hypothetical protein
MHADGCHSIRVQESMPSSGRIVPTVDGVQQSVKDVENNDRPGEQPMEILAVHAIYSILEIRSIRASPPGAPIDI